MSWNQNLSKLLDELSSATKWTYHASGPNSTEPAAMAALALLSHARHAEAKKAIEFLVGLQAKDGSIGVSETQATPAWPTALAIVACQSYHQATASDDFQSFVNQAVAFQLSMKGRTLPNHPQSGHDTTLVGWSWAAKTHSWIEPTSMHVWALKTAGLGDHARVREAVRLLIDRQIPGGGANYGNTFVLQQKLLPHYQPTAISLLALQGEVDPSNRDDERHASIETSATFLADNWGDIRGTSSTCYSAVALAAFDRTPDDLEDRLQSLLKRRRDTTGTYPLSLIALAASKNDCPLTQLNPSTKTKAA